MERIRFRAVGVVVLASIFFCSIGWGARTLLESGPHAGIQDSILTVIASHHPNHCLYVGAQRGLYYSCDGGTTWRRIFHTGLWKGPVQAVQVHPTDPHFLLVAAGTILWSSSDEGVHWHRLHTFREPILSFALDPSNPSRLLLGTEKGVRLSLDQGITWSSQGPSMGPVGTVAFHPLYPGRCYALTAAGLFQSKDSGEHWDRIWMRLREETDSPEEESAQEQEQTFSSRLGGFAIDPIAGKLYLGTPQGILVQSGEESHWDLLSTIGFGAREVQQLILDPDHSGRLYAATRSGLFIYDPNRGDWRMIREGLPTGAIHSIAFEAFERFLWVGTEQGLLRIPAAQESTVTQRPLSSVNPKIPLTEPSIREVQKAAIQYAEVGPEKIQNWRRAAVWRNWLPKLTLSLDQDRDRTIASSSSGGKTTFTVGPEDQSVSLALGFTWDMANLIWNPDQVSIDIRSRLTVQLRQDLLEEVTRAYFERKRLLAEFQGNPTEDPLLTAERTYRIEELNARLDALTGGFFSQRAARQ